MAEALGKQAALEENTGLSILSRWCITPIRTEKGSRSGSPVALDLILEYTLNEIAQMDEFRQLKVIKELFETNMASYPEVELKNVIDLSILNFLPNKGAYSQSDFNDKKIFRFGVFIIFDPGWLFGQQGRVSERRFAEDAARVQCKAVA